MKFIALDLEMDQPNGNIIEIGVAVGDSKTGAIIDINYWFIKQTQPINPKITALTSITDEMLDSEGISVVEAYSQLVEFKQQYDVFVNPVTWGGGDSNALYEQYEDAVSSIGMVGNIFGRRWIDVKTLYVSMCIANGAKPQGGLAKAMTKLGLSFKGKKHRAVDDAANTLLLYFKMLEMYKSNHNSMMTVVLLAYELFNKDERAMGAWFTTPNEALFGDSPFAVCVRGDGARLVKYLRTRLRRNGG